MSEASFERNVFINCPFDKDYEGILQAILFCISYLGFTPRLAKERNNSGEVRLAKIAELIETSKYSIHDLSRCQAAQEGEYFRLNMPFELGLDYGCRKYFGRGRQNKSILILEKERFRYQAAISDLAGCDIKNHGDDVQTAIRQVRNWLVGESGLSGKGASAIYGAYISFQEWYYEKQLAAGFSEEDIQDYPTNELLTAMQEWIARGKP